MRKLPLLVLVCAWFLNSCDDTSSPGGGSKVDGFTIVDVSQDSVYRGETIRLTLAKARTDTFKLFMHTIPITPDSVADGGRNTTYVYFRVPLNAVTGKLRVYEHDSVEAKGALTLFVLPVALADLHPTVSSFDPERGFTNDLLVITGAELPLRQGDIRVTIGTTVLPLIMWTPNYILARITPEVRSGELVVRLLENDVRMGLFEKLGK